MMRNGARPDEAAVRVLERVLESYSIQDDHQIGIITLNRDGIWSSASLREGYTTVKTDTEGTERMQPERILISS